MESLTFSVVRAQSSSTCIHLTLIQAYHYTSGDVLKAVAEQANSREVLAKPVVLIPVHDRCVWANPRLPLTIAASHHWSLLVVVNALRQFAAGSAIWHLDSVNRGHSTKDLADVVTRYRRSHD